MEAYNRFSPTDGYCNAYITCASTGKAAIAINGCTVHTAFKISLSKLLPLSGEVAQQYRALFKYIKVIIIDAVSMIGAELLLQIYSRLKQITGNFNATFGGLDMIFTGDLRQLPPVRATPIYKQPKRRLCGPSLWRALKYYELTQVMRQANVQFSELLTKIGNGQQLTPTQLQLIESRFCTVDQAATECPDGIRLFLTNAAVNSYNNSVLQSSENVIISTSIDEIIGCSNEQQASSFRQVLHKKSVIDTGGLPYEISFVINKLYLITSNIDVSDGLANGAVGKLCFIEQDEQGFVKRVWLNFQHMPTTGQKIRRKNAAFMQDHGISHFAVPIRRRSVSISLNKNKTINAKRDHFPLIPASAMTVHKSQSGTFDNVVYEYHRKHSHQLLYVALSRVTNIEGLFITNKNNNFRFYHGRSIAQDMTHLQQELNRLASNRLITIEEEISQFICNSPELSIFSFNCQSLHCHAADLKNDVIKQSNLLIFSETWLRQQETVDLSNFKLIIKYKRPNTRAGGVAVYHNDNDTVNIVTKNMDIIGENSQEPGVYSNEVGEICSLICKKPDGKTILITAVYIRPQQSISDIIEFFEIGLMRYSIKAAEIFPSARRRQLHKIPLILSGDFNVDFSKEKSQPLINFLHRELGLNMSNLRTVPTTKDHTTIDAVFYRYIDDFQSKIFISYYSHHKPIISFAKHVE